MKTSGFVRLYGIAILLFQVIFALKPCGAQVFFASQRDVSSHPTDKQFALLGNFAIEPGSSKDYFNSPSSGNRGAGFVETGLRKNKVEDSIAALAKITSATRTDGQLSLRTTSFVYPSNARSDVGIAEYPAELLLLYASSLKEYAKQNGFDTSYAFLSNMGMLCDKKRFFIVNLKTMQVEGSGLVSHGRGQGPSIYDKQYSNQAGSRCTSLGRYKIMGRYRGNYGEAYHMTGLDSSNRNAFDRNIVLHSMNCIPDNENRFPACVSDGCPAVSSNFLSRLGKIIDSRKSPVLLWIFDSNLEEPIFDDLYPDPISADLHIKEIELKATANPHTNQLLHDLVRKPARQKNIIDWISKKKNDILRKMRAHGRKTITQAREEEEPAFD